LPNKGRIQHERPFTTRKAYAQIDTHENQLKNNTLATFVEGEENQDDQQEEEEEEEETGKMWRSVVTCIPVQIKPISKRNQYPIEDLQTLEQEQVSRDNRQVLPNIRPIPKSKFVYKGLAYKEVRKLPGIITETDDDNHNNNINSLKKPLIDYNLAQAYVRYEVNAERTKNILRQPPKDQQLTKTSTTLDLREIRKRTVKGTTLPYRPTPQSAPFKPGRVDHRSASATEVLLPIRGVSTLNHALQHHAITRTTPILSQNFDFSPIDNVTNVSLL
jgi:hypothetical protein